MTNEESKKLWALWQKYCVKKNVDCEYTKSEYLDEMITEMEDLLVELQYSTQPMTEKSMTIQQRKNKIKEHFRNVFEMGAGLDLDLEMEEFESELAALLEQVARKAFETGVQHEAHVFEYPDFEEWAKKNLSPLTEETE